MRYAEGGRVTVRGDERLDYKQDVDDLLAKLRATRAVCAERERELLTLKGPCSGGMVGVGPCRLHYAHSGPCDIERTQR